MSERRLPSLRWAAAGVFALALAARLLALLRETLIASSFGLTAELDAIYLGLAVPLALTAGAGGGLSRAAVAVAAGLAGDRFSALARTACFRLVLLILPTSILMAATAPVWVELLRLGDDSPPQRIAAAGAIMGSFLLLGGCLAGLFNGLANASARHDMGSLNPIAYNAIVCLCIYFLHKPLGVYCIGVGLLVAEWLQTLVFLPIIGPLLRSRPEIDGLADWTTLRSLFLPSAIIGTTVGLNVAIDRAFATSLDSGSIAALGYAERIINLPVALVATALAVPLYTRLSHHFRNERDELGRDTLHLGVRLILLIGTPLAVYTAVFAVPIVGLLLERGNFDANDVRVTSIAIAGYAVAVPFQAMTTLLTSAGLLGTRAWPTVRIMLATCVLNAILNAALVGPLGILGIALATSVVGLVRTVLLLRFLSPGCLTDRGLWRTLFTSVLMAVAIPFPLIYARTQLIESFAPDFAGRFVILALGALVLMLALGLLTPFVLWREWLSLGQLRRRVAEGTNE